MVVNLLTQDDSVLSKSKSIKFFVDLAFDVIFPTHHERDYPWNFEVGINCDKGV